jgi:hypothetical protein
MHGEEIRRPPALPSVAGRRRPAARVAVTRGRESHNTKDGGSECRNFSFLDTSAVVGQAGRTEPEMESSMTGQM